MKMTYSCKQADYIFAKLHGSGWSLLNTFGVVFCFHGNNDFSDWCIFSKDNDSVVIHPGTRLEL